MLHVYHTDLRRQKIQLSMEIREQLDAEEKKCGTNYEQELQDIVSEIKSAVDLSRHLVMIFLPP